MTHWNTRSRGQAVVYSTEPTSYLASSAWTAGHTGTGSESKVQLHCENLSAWSWWTNDVIAGRLPDVSPLFHSFATCKRDCQMTTCWSRCTSHVVHEARLQMHILVYSKSVLQAAGMTVSDTASLPDSTQCSADTGCWHGYTEFDLLVCNAVLMQAVGLTSSNAQSLPVGVHCNVDTGCWHDIV